MKKRITKLKDKLKDLTYEKKVSLLKDINDALRFYINSNRDWIRLKRETTIFKILLLFIGGFVALMLLNTSLFYVQLGLPYSALGILSNSVLFIIVGFSGGNFFGRINSIIDDVNKHLKDNRKKINELRNMKEMVMLL